MNRDTRRRLEALEAKLVPTPVFHWSPWQEILTPEEDSLLRSFSTRPARYELFTRYRGDAFTALEVLCADDAERALFAAIIAKADAPFGPRWHFLGREGYGLDAYFADLCL